MDSSPCATAKHRCWWSWENPEQIDREKGATLATTLPSKTIQMSRNILLLQLELNAGTCNSNRLKRMLDRHCLLLRQCHQLCHKSLIRGWCGTSWGDEEDRAPGNWRGGFLHTRSKNGKNVCVRARVLQKATLGNARGAQNPCRWQRHFLRMSAKMNLGLLQIQNYFHRLLRPETNIWDMCD